MKLTFETESRIAQLLESGFSTKFVMQDCNVCRQTVVHVRKKRLIDDVDFDRRNQTIRFLQLSGFSNEEIAEHMQISDRTVKMVIATYEKELIEEQSEGIPSDGDIDTAWVNFANGIILKGVKDLKQANKTLKKRPGDYNSKCRKEEVENFFHSTWFNSLSDVDPDYLLNRIAEMEKKEAQESSK